MSANSLHLADARREANDQIADIINCLEAGKAVRRDIGKDGRLHIDRPLPFLCLYIAGGVKGLAARNVASANASYLIAASVREAMLFIEAVGTFMQAKYGSFIVLNVGELEHDILLADDSPSLPHFEISVTATPEPATQLARQAFIKAVCDVKALFRTPRITEPAEDENPLSALQQAGLQFPCISVRYAPIYRQPESGAIYPDLRERLIANIFDAGLQAVSAFAGSTGALKATTHRSLGRKAFVDSVRRADRSIDDVVSSFDFLLAVTPINARQAFKECLNTSFNQQPQFLYRPLGVDVEMQKRKLYSVDFENLEDPVLYRLYREKQQEIDLQLSMLQALHDRRFADFSRALYGPVESELKTLATDILARCQLASSDEEVPLADCYEVVKRAREMIKDYQRLSPDFKARVEIRDDIPPGLMVTGSRLLVARTTVMERRRIEALLSHEIGVHLLTYFNGAAQGLLLFRTGLSGYEGVQEGLAVLAEYLAGGMTRERLRLISARVLACATMLDGATFIDTFRMLTGEHGFDDASAFNLTLRVYRGGGLSKDAIYLRGLAQVLNHVRNGGSLEPFWMGKISADHFPVMQELALRGLLHPPGVHPAFLNPADARTRLAKVKAGLPMTEMATL